MATPAKKVTLATSGEWSPEVKAAIALALAEGLVVPSGTTAARPAAATAGVGAVYYDTTLGKPIWSNGTAWRDSAGVAA